MRQIVEDLPVSKIRELADAALGRDDVLAFRCGESDEPTPMWVRAVAARALDAGATFWSRHPGLPESGDVRRFGGRDGRRPSA